MPGKPGFTRVDLTEGTVHVCGASADDESPAQIQVAIFQRVNGQEKPHAAVGTQEHPPSDWDVPFDAKGFAKGGCVVVGNEVLLEPHFSTRTWVQYMDIE